MPLKHSVEEIKLKNGARGLLIHTPDATAVHYDIQFRAGTDYAESESISQVAHIMEHMSFGPNKQHASLEEFSREFGKNGAYHNAWTSDVSMVYIADAALMEWKRILELQLLAISEPRFDAESLASEKGNVREEIIGYGNNLGRILWQEVTRTAGLKRWYDASELKTVDAVTLEDITAHYKKTHTARNMRFVLVGNLKEYQQEIITMLEHINLPLGELLPMKEDAVKPLGPVFIPRKDAPSLEFTIPFYLPRELSEQEAQILYTLNYIITGTMHSRIWGKARVLGICYGMSSSIDTDATGSASWSINGQVSPKNIQELIELIAKELLDIAKNGVTDTELQEATTARIGAFQMGTETVRSLANWYGVNYYESDAIDLVQDAPTLVSNVTGDMIKDMLNEFLSSNAWGFGGVGDMSEDDFKKQYDILAQRLNKG